MFISIKGKSNMLERVMKTKMVAVGNTFYIIQKQFDMEHYLKVISYKELKKEKANCK